MPDAAGFTWFLDDLFLPAQYTNGDYPRLWGHEMGHSFNLYHTFEGDNANTQCPVNTNPATDGDRISDTDPHKQGDNCATYSTSATNACTGLPFGALLQNMMSYSGCLNRFTPKQVERMRYALQYYRPGLINSFGKVPPVVGELSPTVACVVSAPGGISSFFGIESFTFNTISVGGGGPTSENGANYSDRTCLVQTNVQTGIPYSFSLTSLNGNELGAKIFIDYNNNGSFLDANEQVFSSGNYNSSFSGTITIPVGTTANTKLRMRVMLDPTLDLTACSLPGFSPYGSGMAEDYAITVVPATTCTAALATLSGSQTSNPGQPVSLTTALTGTSPWNLTLNTGQVFSNITASPFVFTVAPATSTTYAISKVSNACGNGTVNGSAVVTVNTPCTAAVATLSGSQTSTPGQPVSLTTTLTGTSPWSLTLNTGQVFTNISTSPFGFTVAPTTTTTYTIAKVTNACGIGSVSGSATVTPCSAAVATLAGSQTSTPGQSVSLSVALIGTSPWSLTLNTGQVFTNITASPFAITVAPTISTTYTISRVSNSCGIGSVSGSATVTPYIPAVTTLFGSQTSTPRQTTDPLTPTISGTATPGSLITITDPFNQTVCTTTASASGTFACGPISVLPVGPNTLTVTATWPGGSTSQPITFTIVSVPTVAIVSPANNTTQPAATKLVSGTATPGAQVVLTTSTGSFTTSADPTTGAYSVTGLSFPAGPNTVTATASNAGGMATTASTFTVAGPPSLTVTGPVNVSTTTPTLAGTATPGSQIVITGPGPITLCTTTASASGTFACALGTTLPVGPNTLTVTASGPGGSTSVPVTFTVHPTPPTSQTNLPPVAIDDTLLTQKGVSATGTVATNDSDPNVGQTLTFSRLSGPTNGTVVLNGNGTYTWTPAPTFVGSDLFTYQVCDNASPALCATATAHLTVPAVVSNSPVLTPDIANTNPNTPVTGNVLTNDTDPQGLPLTASLLTPPGAGTVVISPSGSYTYTPPVGFTGTVSFCYSASNTTGQSGSACVSINVQQPLRTGVVSVPVRVFLQGALTRPGTIVGPLMRDDLRRKGLIPTMEPYTALGYVHVGGGSNLSIANPSAVFSVTGANAIIDWVMVELRSTTYPYVKLASTPGLLQADGDVVQTDGVSTVAFSQSALGATAYQVSVHHRNHLSVMTANPISLTGTVAVVDFTSASTPIYQLPSGDTRTQTAPLALERGLLALWADNTNGDQLVILQGPNNDVDPVFFDVVGYAPNTAGLTNYIRSDVYLNSDVDMNGQVIFQGEDNEVDILFFEIMLHPGNEVGQFINYIIWQQLL